MAQFNYIAVERSSGRERKGVVESLSRERATLELKQQGLAPISLVAAQPGEKAVSAGTENMSVKKRSAVIIGRVVNAKELALFTRQLAVLLRAKMPLLRSLEVLQRQEKNKLFRGILGDVAERVRSGGALSDGMMRHPKAFEPVYVNMIRAGEASGAVGEVMTRLAVFMEKSIRLRSRIRSAMTYPVVIVVVAVTIVSILMAVVVPKFEGIFSGMLKGQPLPALTQAVLGFSRLVKDNLLISLIVVAVTFAIFYLFKRTVRGALFFDRSILRMPVVGTLLMKTMVARFARTLGTLLTSGVPILQAIGITRDAVGNRHAAAALQKVHDRVKAGEGIAVPLDASGIFPAMVTSMIDVGEETSSVSEMLTKVADIYEEEVDHSVSALTALIEPVMIVVMAVLVGTIVIALFLPIVRIVQLMS